MFHQPLVSIITVVFNGEKHLEQTIKSVISQTYPNIEYIIIDGGSNDHTIDIIRRYNEKLAYWESEPDKGISDAFNKGIIKAKGEIIGLINADDWYEKDAVEKAVAAISGFDVVFGKLQYWKNNKKDMVSEGSERYLLNQMTINHPTVFIKTYCYQKYGLFNLSYRYAMDYELALRLKAAGCTFKYIPEILANMRWDGVSDEQWYKACKEVLYIKNQYFPKRKFINKLYFLKQILAITVGKFLEKMNLSHIVQYYRNRLSLVKKSYN